MRPNDLIDYVNACNLRDGRRGGFGVVYGQNA